MKRNRIICLFVVIILSLMPFSVNCIAENNNAELYTITASTDSNYCYYGSTVVENLTAKEAQNKGIPAGYSGDVHSVLGNGSKGALVDFSDAKIPTSVVKSMTFRVYVGDDQRPADAYPEVRISWPNKTTSWIMRYNVSSMTDRWIDITLDANGQNFYGNVGFNDLSKDGYLAKFGLAIRTYASIDQAFYIDDISLEYKENDYTPPVITYTGESVIRIPEGSDILTNATAYDSTENRNVDVYWVWPEGTKLTDNGTPVKGTYNAKLCAKDFYGNVSEKSVTVQVIEKDITPPVIDLKVNKIYAVNGTIPRLSVKVTDNNEIKSEEYIWSEKALDKRGRLTEGTHYWTIKAEDTSGNKTTKILTVYVTKNEKLNATVVDEDALSRGGDLNGDGIVSSLDLVFCRKALLSGDKADVNGDGLTNVIDLVVLKKALID